MDTPQQALIDTVNRYPWKFWGALTPLGNTSPQSLDKTYRKWIRRLNRANHAKVNDVYVVETSPSGHVHVHVQLGPMNISIRKMLDLWISSGGGPISRIEPYDAEEGSWYTVKDFYRSDFGGIDTRRMTPVAGGAA